LESGGFLNSEVAGKIRLEYKAENLKHIQAAGSVLLLEDMHQTSDLHTKRAIFEQVCDQESSHISEVLPGVVNTKFDFDVRDGKLYALQPNGVTDWRELHENGVARARSMAEFDDNFKFYEDISAAELNEALVQERLVNLNKPAAIITLSLSGDDLANADILKKLGRDPAQKRAFLRVSWTNGTDKQIYLDSRSIDGMDLKDGIDFLNELGVELPDDANSLDVLSSQVVIDDLDEIQLSQLADELVAKHDRRLLEKTGLVHKAGRSEHDARDTYEFVLNQHDLLNMHMESLCELARRELPLPILAKYTDNLMESVSHAGGAERSMGTTFDGCDTSIGFNSSNQNLANTGMLNAQNREGWAWVDGKCKIDECPSRNEAKSVKVGPCKVCVRCQNLFDKKMSLRQINNYYKSFAPMEESEESSSFDIIAADLARIERKIQEDEMLKEQKKKLRKQKEQEPDFLVAD
jgi:hypothetical protein